MLGVRVIPCLLLKGCGLVKTRRFKAPTYVGDPVNTVRIFNEKGADEIVLLDIMASKSKNPPNYGLLSQIASECFMPLGYGGGLSTIDQIRTVLRLGYEKVILNTIALQNLEVIQQAATEFGSQSVVVSIDVKRSWRGQPFVFSHAARKLRGGDPRIFAEQAARAGAGELIVTSVDRDGCFGGYDIEIIRAISAAVSIPVVACGGAAEVAHLEAAVRDGGASAVSAGSMFVFQGRHRAMLISYPDSNTLERVFPERAYQRLPVSSAMRLAN